MKTYTTATLICVLVLAGMTGYAASTPGDNDSGITDQVLLNQDLQVAPGRDVIVDRVSLPPNAVLPRRWHPGEMFVYVMAGNVIVSPDGEDETVATAGDLITVPFKKVYSARTSDDGAQLVIFRVHESNQPIRVLVD